MKFLSSYHLVCSSLSLPLRKSGLEKADSGPEWKTEAAALETGFKNTTPPLPPAEKTLLKMKVVLKSSVSVVDHRTLQQFLRVSISPGRIKARIKAILSKGANLA